MKRNNEASGWGRAMSSDDQASQLEVSDSETPLPRPPQINTTMSSLRIAIIISSMHGHIAKMAESAKQGVEKAGGQASIFQISETLSPEILAKMHAPPKLDYPIINLNNLSNYDGCPFGVPTRGRYGNLNMPAQWRTLKSIMKIGTMFFNTFSCFFMLFQLFRMIMKSKEGMKIKKLSYSLLQLLARWHSALEATSK